MGEHGACIDALPNLCFTCTLKSAAPTTTSQANCLSLQSAERRIRLSMATFCLPPTLVGVV